MGGKVNNRTVSIREQLHNGDIVEILTQKNQTPKSDWLNFVVTSKARNKIKSYLREEQAKHTRMGREELERKLKNWKFTLTIDEAVAYLVKYFKVRTGTEVYALIATQKVDLGTIKEILARHISGEADEQRRAAAAEAERNKVHNVRESTAPQDALVLRVLATPGQTAARDEPLVLLLPQGEAASGGLWLRAGFLPEDARRLKPGQPCDVRLEADGRILAGTVADLLPQEVAPAGDAAAPAAEPAFVKNNTALTYVRIRLDVADSSGLVPGMAARCSVRTRSLW